MDTKPMWASKTMWGAALLLASFILSYFGVELTPAEQAEGATNIVALIEQIMAAFGWVMVVVGRFAARTKVTVI